MLREHYYYLLYIHMSQYVCDGLVKKVQNSGMELQQVSNESHGTTLNIEEARGQRHGTGIRIVEVETNH